MLHNNLHIDVTLQGVGYGEPSALDPSLHAGVNQMPIDSAGMPLDGSYMYGELRKVHITRVTK